LFRTLRDGACQGDTLRAVAAAMFFGAPGPLVRQVAEYCARADIHDGAWWPARPRVVRTVTR
jgi:hypothetical protein